MLNPRSGDDRLRRGHAIATRCEASDPVERWKRLALTRAADEQRAQAGEAPLRLKISLPFVLFATLFGLPFGLLGPLAMQLLLSSVLLLHELPRALVARATGHASLITISLRGADTSGGARTVFLVSGSIANALTGSLVAALMQSGVLPQNSPLLKALWLSHAAWALAQLIPAIPFQLGRAIARGLRPAARLTYAALSFVLFCLALPLANDEPLLFPLFALAATLCGAALFQAYCENADALSGVPALTRQAALFLSGGDCVRGAEVAEQGLGLARSRAQRDELWRQLAWCAIGRRDAFTAHAALRELPAGAIDLHLVASYLACCNRNGEAVKLLERARALGHRARETTKLLVDLLFGAGEEQAAFALASADHALLTGDDLQALEFVLPRASA